MKCYSEDTDVKYYFVINAYALQIIEWIIDYKELT